MRKRCASCQKLTEKWQRINGSPWHCYDGCFSTLGYDKRTVDGLPAWLPTEDKKAWDPKRLWKNYMNGTYKLV